jgi:uncharacterized protein (TIGR03382 family)
MVRLGIASALAICLGARGAHAFPGLYVAASDAPMFGDATQVVLMRDGTRTVVSMRTSYQGPPEAFAMVIPVPALIKESDVKTLAPDVFATIERLGSPRLVEYWEQDPCTPAPRRDEVVEQPSALAARDDAPTAGPARDGAVTIEGQFTAGEYQIVVLSAKDSAGLDAWLRREKYQVPAGAEPLLRSYVEGGMKFFVAKVDPKKVVFEPATDGRPPRAVLSPLRFHYDSDRFELPIRLGLANSAGTQDLIVNILAPGQRYEVANYPNVTIPTNLAVTEDVRDRFDAFYVALFDATLDRNPDAVVTEYAWDASTCEPCPGPTLRPSHIRVLGGDVLQVDRGLVLTRLHARYGKDIQHDLVFREAQPIAGGREHFVATGKLEERAQKSHANVFQARYTIRHAWDGPIRCSEPVRGRWGGPPAARDQPSVQSALDLAFAPRDAVTLAEVVRQDIPELGVGLAGAQAMLPANAPATGPAKTKAGCSASGDSAGGLVVVFGLAWLFWTRRR